MLKWFSGEEAGAMQGAPGSPQGSADGGGPAVSEMTERLAQTEQLVAQLKELIREKDAELRSRDEQLKAEKESCEAKLSKIRLQNKAKVTSLNAQLEEFRKQQGDAKGKDSPLKIKRSGSGEAGDSEVPAASRGKILLLKKKVEELEHQLSQRDEDLGIKVQELEAQRERGVEMDAMLVERDRKLAEKEAYIVHLQMGLSGGQTGTNTTTQEHQVQSSDASSSIQELQLLVQSLTKKVGEGEERYSLLQEQADSLRALLETEKAQYEEKENMYKQNIQTFKDIILQKDNNLLELNQKHEQELFRLAAKSDASADLEQLLKALKQKLHEKEEVLLGKNQVVDVLQGEVDSRDQQIKELMERMRRLQSERENLQSKLEAEKHVMRAQLLDLMQKHEVELLRVAEKHEHEMSEKEQAFRAQLEESKRMAAPPFSSAPAAGDTPSLQRLSELEGQVKLKAEEASKSETKFLKMKAWSKSRIRQLEDELKKAQSGSAAPDVTSLRSRITELEEQRQEILCKLETYDELKARNDLLEKKLVVYEEQQRKMQADLEQVTKRAASQASESGSVEEFQSQVLEWQDMVSMVTEAEAARDQAREEKNAMALRMSHIEEEREALANRQQELEEEMARERGLRRASKKLGDPVPRSIQEDFEFDGHRSFPDPSSPSGSTTPMEGENMGEGLRSVVEELELERNQLQEQILALEERCQDLEDRRQLQSRIEALQNESERLQAQVSSLRSQQMREAEKHQLLVSSLNEQLKGLSDTQECLESSLMEKEHTLAKTSEKLELIDSLQDSLKQKEEQYKDVADKLIQTEHNLSEMTKKFNTFEKQCTDLKVTVTELTHKLSLLKEKTQKQEATNESLQTELDQTNEELDKLNTAHLEERAELIHDLQSCEREIDNLKDILIDKDKEINGLSGNMAEYADQIHGLKQEIKQKDEDLLRTENALRKAEREAQIIRETQSSDQQSLNAKVAELLEEMKDTESELKIAREQKDLKMLEAEDLTKQVRADRQTIQDLRTEIQKLNVNHCSHLTECEIQISSLKDQLSVASKKLHEAESLHSQLMETAASNEKLKDQLHDKAQIYEKELKSYKDEQNKLLAEVSKHKGELQSLSKQLEEQVQSQEQVERMVEEKLGLITSLEQKLKDTQKESEGERLKLSADLKAKDIEMDKMNKELADKSEGYLKLETQLDSLRADNQEVQAAFEKRREEFMAQKKLAEELSEKVRDVLEQNSSMQLEVNKLMVENGNLQQEIAEKFKSFSELMLERDFLLSKMGVLEAEHSEKGKIVDDRLLEKTNECNHLSKLLHESKMHCTSLQDQVKNTHSQVDHLNSGLEEKDKCIADQNIQIQTQQSQISQLQEQGAALKSGLIEKDNMLQEQAREFKSLQVELQQLKQACSELQNETDAIKKECSRLTQVLDEKESLLQTKNQDCQSHIDELNKRNESVVSLSSQLGNMNEVFVKLETENANLKASLASHVSDSSKLSEALGLRQEDIAALQNHVQTVTEQNRQLRSLFQIKEKEFVGLQQIVGELDNKAAGLLEQNSQLSSQICSLTEQNEKLGQERDEKCKQISDTEQENVALERKLSGLELQHSENRKIIEGLMKDKEQLFKNKETISENLLEKTNECSRLTSLLRDLEENSVFLKEQADSANTRANNLESTLAEKEEEIAEKNAQKESQQSQINQHQETLNLLQEQGRALKSGLMEKDLLLQQKAEEHSSLLAEIQQQKDTFSKLQNDMDTLKSECSSLSQNLEEKDMIISSKNQECQSHMDELTKRNESVFSLSGQLADINENLAKLDEENVMLKGSVENYSSENARLREEMTKVQSDFVDLQDSNQALKEQTHKLKAEIQKFATDASVKLEEMTFLKNELSDRDKFLNTLREQMAATNTAKQDLQLTLQQKDDSLKQQEMFIKQLQAKSVEGEGQMSQQMETITELQKEAQSLQAALQSKDMLLLEKERNLTCLKETLVSESDKSQSQVSSSNEIISKLQQELKVALETSNHLTEKISQLDLELKQKADECLTIKEHISSLEDSHSQIQTQMQNLTSECDHLKKTLTKKEQDILNMKSTSLACTTSLNEQLKAKESECDSLKEQLSGLNDTISKLNISLRAQSSEISSLQEAFKDSTDALLEQTKAVQDLQRKADESALFKAQFMESTELVAQLQDQIQELSMQSTHLKEMAEEKQSALMNLQEKYATHSEELHKCKTLLSQRDEEISNLQKALKDCSESSQAAENIANSLRHECALLQDEVQNLRTSSAELSKQKTDALSAHERNSSSLTVEIEMLKSQHVHVAAQVTALTENLEQREMALHAINSQYSAQVKHAEHLLLEVEKLTEQNRRLQEEFRLTEDDLKMKLNTEASEKEAFAEVAVKDKAELEKKYKNLIQKMEDQFQAQIQQQTCNMSETLKKMELEKEHLHAQVSVKAEEIMELKSESKRIEQILQESENEWLSVLDKETKEKSNLLAQLQTFENELTSKDRKVQDLKQDLDCLNEKLTEASLALELGSDKLKEKEADALACRNKLEEILSIVQLKENENLELRQIVQEAKEALRNLGLSKECFDQNWSDQSQTMSDKLPVFEEEKMSLLSYITQLQENHSLEVSSLREELSGLSQQLHQNQSELLAKEKECRHEDKQLVALQEQVEILEGQLLDETERQSDLTMKLNTSLLEIQNKEDKINFMNIQISQQKELISSLNNQMKEREASVTQVVTSALNERMTFTEERDDLMCQIKMLEKARGDTAKELEDICAHLEVKSGHLSHCQSQLEAKDIENKELVKENYDLKTQINKLVQEKDGIKKKLQAALIARKELLKKIEDLQHYKEDGAKCGNELSEMKLKVEQLTVQALQYEADVDNLQQQIKLKDNEVAQLVHVITEKEQLTEEKETILLTLKAELLEQNGSFMAVHNTLKEKEGIIDQLKTAIVEKEEASSQLLKELEHLKDEMTKKEGSFREEVTNSQATTADIESELAKVTKEKGILQKKAQAALLARKETLKKTQESEKKYMQEISELKERLEEVCQQTNEFKLKYENTAQVLEDITQTYSSSQNDLEMLRADVEQKDIMLQDLRMALSEHERRAKDSSNILEEMELLQVNFQDVTSEMAHKDESLALLEQKSQDLASKLAYMQSVLEKAYDEIKEKNSHLEKHELTIDRLKQEHDQVQQELLEQQQHLSIFHLKVDELKENLEASETERQRQSCELESAAKNHEEEKIQIQSELQHLLATVVQKSEELQTLQNVSSETELQLKDVLSKYGDSQAEVESCKLHIETLEQEKNCVITNLETAEKKVTALESCLKELQKEHYNLLVKVEVMEEKQLSAVECESVRVPPEQIDRTDNGNEGERDLVTQTAIAEKDDLIASLEQQLQRQIHFHELEMEKMRTEVSELQRSSRPEANLNQAMNENKSTEQLTKKLQAALISRKEALKENKSLKESVQALSTENEQLRTTSSALECFAAELKSQKMDQEIILSSLNTEKERLVSKIERMSSENHNLSAACESLKLTIENITQQKQAFSCQLESLKDSQTVELSEWKSKHTELKQEYESLLQAYENVSSEMDKMRQVLEGARRERQETLLKAHKCESDKESLEKRLSEVEEENEKMKEKMRKYAKSKQEKIEELEEENGKIKKVLDEYEEKQNSFVEELTLKNRRLETEIATLRNSSDDLQDRFSEIQVENLTLAEKLAKTSSMLEKWQTESKTCENNLQLKLNDALSLNSSLTSQIEAQKGETVAQQETLELFQKVKEGLMEKVKEMQTDHDAELAEKYNTVAELKETISRNEQEIINLNEKVRILEDDKCLFQEELENAQEISDKVKNENEYLETEIVKNSNRTDELTEIVNVLQSQNVQLSTQLSESKEEKVKICQEKEEQQLKLMREYDEKLKTYQRGNEGSRNMKKELQELLKEKHQEINQLQHDCIQYQELILNLERSFKHSQSEQDKLEKELKEKSERVNNLLEQSTNTENEISRYKNSLNEAMEHMAASYIERDQLRQEVTEKDRLLERHFLEREQALEALLEQQKSLQKDQQTELQNKIGELLHLKEKEAEVVLSLRMQLDSQNLQIKTLMRDRETNSAKMAVLSAGPESASALKQWEEIFQKTLHEKDSQLLEQGHVINRLFDEIRGKVRVINELQVASKRLERSLGEYTLAASAQQRQLLVMGASNTELNEHVERLSKRLQEQSAYAERVENDKSSLNRELSEKMDSFTQMQSNLEYVEKALSNSKSELTSLQSQYDQLLVDFEKQEAMLPHMKLLLKSKDAEISSLLSSRDGQMSGYLEQLQANHRAQIEGYESRIKSLYRDRETSNKELRKLEGQFKTINLKTEKSIQEKEQMSVKIDSLKNSVVSLQSEKDGLMSAYRALQQSGAKNKEGSSEGDCGASKSLKQEIKTLLHQMDDLNSENAMLKAQLIRYREDLNQVLSLKDNQLKELLKKQQDSIRNLEKENAVLQRQHREYLAQLEGESETIKVLKTQNSKMQSQIQELETSLVTLHKEKLEADEGKVIADLQQAVAAKASECNDLQQKLFAQNVAVDDLKLSLQQVEGEMEKTLGEAKNKHSSELKAIEREVGLMRNERETADRRVAELAKDLMRTEQLLSESRSQCKDLKSQNDSLGKAMAALQNDRDQLIDDFKVLQNRYDEELREMAAARNKIEKQLGNATSELTTLTSERNVLIQKAVALEATNPHAQLCGLVDNLSRAASEKEVALKQVSEQNSTYSKQIAAFSKAMASLQNDRDRLIEELTGARRALESRQQSFPDTNTPVAVEELNSLRGSVDALQTQRDGLLKETVSLKAENAELKDLRLKCDDQQRALHQTQAYRLQCEKDFTSYKAELAELRAEKSILLSEQRTWKSIQSSYPAKESVALLGKTDCSEHLAQPQRDLQSCVQEIHQREALLEQLNARLQQAVDEKNGVSSQLKAVSQTLRESQLNLNELQNRCYWLERQVQIQQAPTQRGLVSAEVAPGAPQEKSSSVVDIETTETQELRNRLSIAECQLASSQQIVSQLNDRLEDERARRLAAEEALGFTEERVKSMDATSSRSSLRDFSIQLETEDEWEALILDPNQHVLMRKVKGGVLSCKRWLRGRSLYCSKLLTTRAKSRYLFLSYLLILHVLVFMCLSGVL